LTRFRGRDAELARLREFADGDSQFQWWSIAGLAGIGKSRLALELMLRLNSIWRMGFLERGEDTDFDWNLWQPQFSTFIAIDYAAQRLEATGLIIETLARRSRNGQLERPVRLLLIDRDPELLRHWRDSLVTGSALPTRFAEPLVLPSLDNRVLTAIGRDVMGPQGEGAAFARLRTLDPEGRPLFACYAAAVAMSDPSATDLTMSDLVRHYLNRNLAIFWRGATDRELDAIAVATLCGGITYRDLRDPALNHLDLPKPDRPMADQLRWIFGDQALAGVPALHPSIAGEVFVLDHIAGKERLGEDPRKLAAAAWLLAPNAMHAFVVRAEADLPRDPAVEVLTRVAPPSQDGEATSMWAGLLEMRARRAVFEQRLDDAESVLHCLLSASEHGATAAYGHAATVAAELIARFGPDGYKRSESIFLELLVPLNAITDPAPLQNRTSLTQKRRNDLAFGDRVMQIVRGDRDDRDHWMVGLVHAIESFVQVQRTWLLPRGARNLAEMWRKLADTLDQVRAVVTAGRLESNEALVLRNRGILLRAEAGQIGFAANLAHRELLQSLLAAEEAAQRMAWADCERALIKAFNLTPQAALIGDEADPLINEVMILLPSMEAAGEMAAARRLLSAFLGISEPELTAASLERLAGYLDEAGLRAIFERIAARH
jgi:hypothetical protein